MKILVWGGWYPEIGGLETWLVNFIPALADRGHQVFFISSTRTEMDLSIGPVAGCGLATGQLGVKTDRDSPFEMLKAGQSLRRLIAKFDPNILHFHPTSIEMLIFKSGLRDYHGPLVTTLHADIKNPFWNNTSGIVDVISRRSQCVTAVSEFVRVAAMETGFFSRHDVVKILNALPDVDAPDVDFDPQAVMALGRVVPEKGFDVILRAMAIVVAKRPRAKLKLAGDGAELANLRDLVRQLGLTDNVDLAGWLHPDRVIADMAAHAAVIVPSVWNEPFGLVALEAAQAGRACIASRVGGLPEIVEDGRTGYLVDKGDAEQLAARILDLMADPERARVMGENAAMRARAAFGFDRMVDDYAALLTRVADDAVR